MQRNFWGKAVYDLCVHWVYVIWLSTGIIRLDRTQKWVIHEIITLPQSIHNTIHMLATTVDIWVIHAFHKTYNYNNLYKENCV